MLKFTPKKIKETLIVGAMLLTPLALMYSLKIGYINAQMSTEMPYGIWGSVMIDGKPATDGTEVTAWISGIRIASTKTITGGMYTLTVPADNPETKQKEGGIRGDVVSYKINGTKTDLNSFWKSKFSDQVNLRE